jgi:SAM-dependent methyltransferase
MEIRLHGATRGRGLLLVFAVAACATFTVLALAQGALSAEADRLAKVLGVEAGSAVAEVGAGGGEMTAEIVRRVGESGQVYSTELGDDKVASLREAASSATHVTVIAGAEDETRLPTGCCDAIYMRRVYHHFTSPGRMDASLFASLRPGGRLAVIDFEPRGGTPPAGVPANRKGHGVAPKIVVDELTRAGFEHVRTEDWTEGMFLALFRKPNASPPQAADFGGDLPGEPTDDQPGQALAFHAASKSLLTAPGRRRSTSTQRIPGGSP